jgi:hypothetical protein
MSKEIPMNQGTRLTRKLARGAVALGMALAVVLPGPAHAQDVTPPTVPANLQVPAGNEAFLVGHARGTQNYACQLNTTSGTYVWTFVAPSATLYDDAGNQIATHYAGPTWQANDGSTVVGKKLQSADSPLGKTVAIPWLLLSALSTTTGPDGGNTLTDTTYIQRVNTTGGVAPASGCDATTVGATADVSYTADYYFYVAENSQ